MRVDHRKIKIADLTDKYTEDVDKGVTGYGGMLNIRPAYQREFVYSDKQRNAVIKTVLEELPLNIFYWSDTKDGGYELLDGQQRTISICEYVDKQYSINGKYFDNLTRSEREAILNYEINVEVCIGDETEKLEWFKRINTAGEKLTEQELRNAVYTGTWLTDAKKFFSKRACAAYNAGNKYITGTPIRQDYLETALSWISNRDGISIEEYMYRHKNDANANELRAYFLDVIHWINKVIPEKYYRKEMKGVSWGELFNSYGTKYYDPDEFEAEVQKLVLDDSVTNKKGIYTYIFTGEEKSLSIRAFSESMKRTAYERQGKKCALCGEQFDIKDMEADHIDPWSRGGKTTADNCQMLCRKCNRRKGNK